MKRIFLFYLLGLTFAFSSCDNTTNPCEDVLCESNAVCDEGTCQCEVGYTRNMEGRCVLSLGIARDKFVKLWSVTRSCTALQDVNFANTIMKHPTEEDQLILKGCHFSNRDAYAVMTSATSFDIPLQIYGSSYLISGTGSYIEGTGRVEINYVLEDDDGSSSLACSLLYN